MTEACDLDNEIKAAKEKYFSLLLKQREMKAAERKVCFDLPNRVNFDDFSLFCPFGFAIVWKPQHTKAAFFTRQYGLAVLAGEVLA